MKRVSFYLKGIITSVRSHLNLIEDPIESVTKSIDSCSTESFKIEDLASKENKSSEASG